jgi:hypothetical protein
MVRFVRLVSPVIRIPPHDDAIDFVQEPQPRVKDGAVPREPFGPISSSTIALDKDLPRIKRSTGTARSLPWRVRHSINDSLSVGLRLPAAGRKTDVAWM